MATIIGGGTNGIAFLVSYGLVAELIAKACSSPQTAELNAEKRAPTLMKWVHVGQVESLAIILIAASIDKPHRNAILTGGILSMVVTEGQYLHAKQAGLQNPGQPTEQYGG